MYFEKGDAVSLVVESLDDEGAGTPSNTVTIQNTPPPAPGVTLTPDEPYAGVDTLRCAVSGVGDFDDDRITYRMEWTKNGEAWSALPSPPSDGADMPGQYDTGDLRPEPPPDPSEVPGSHTAAGDEWACTVAAFDGDDWSLQSVATVRIRGSFSGWDDNTHELKDADYRFVGEVSDDRAGASLSFVGDVDADGLGDFAIPAFFNDESGFNAGKVYLVRAADLPPSGGDIELAEAVIAAIADGAVGIKRSETFAAGLHQRCVAFDVEESLKLAGETRFGQIFGGCARACSDAWGCAAFAKFVISGDDGVFQLARHGAIKNHRAHGLADLRERVLIFLIFFQLTRQLFLKIVFLEEETIGGDRDGETVRHIDACR